MTTNPGIITKTNIQRYDHFPYDHLLFTPDRICSTTGVRRLARSKYDRFKYKQNVARFDHYCGWVYNSIGEENYRFFLLFLLVHAGTYSSQVCTQGAGWLRKQLELYLSIQVCCCHRYMHLRIYHSKLALIRTNSRAGTLSKDFFQQYNGRRDSCRQICHILLSH